MELLTGALFAAVGARFGADAALPAFLVFTAVLLAVGAIDLEHFIVPNRLLLAGSVVGGPLLVVATLGSYGPDDLLGALLGALLAGGALFLIALAYPRGMGMGDVKLAAFEGLFLGFLDLGHVALGLFLGFLLGSIGGVALLATGLKTRKDHIPFAPFLAAGALLAVLVGRQLLDLYTR
jgi:leader peptidase (prepilin peptidase)/N-methyltransferase